jgi:hypothetical protein
MQSPAESLIEATSNAASKTGDSDCRRINVRLETTAVT